MSRILELLRAEGVCLDDAKLKGPKSKVIAQADAMLAKLNKMTSVEELNSKTSNQNWWAIKPTGEKRKVTIRYGGRTVDNATDVVENSLDAVRDTIRAMRRGIEKTTDADWAEEEKKRKSD